MSDAVVEAVAAATGRDETELEPLFDAVDPDALDDLFDRGSTARRRADVRVAFRYAGCRVAVGPDGTVAVATESGSNR